MAQLYSGRDDNVTGELHLDRKTVICANDTHLRDDDLNGIDYSL